MTLSPVLVRELAAARPRFNALVAAARRARSGFDTAALADAVSTRLDPLTVAVEAVAPDRTALVVDAGFALTVTLVDHALSGERRVLVDRAWREVAVPLAAVVAERPEPTLAMLTNAALTLAATPGARVDEWMTRMASVASLLDADTLAGAGQVVAWRAGMAHYRDGALAAADALPEALALAATGAEGSWSEVRAALAADRWWTPEGSAAGTRFGGFTGYGGPFSAPPEVRAGAQGVFVRSGARTGLIVADAWGATLHPASEHEFDAARPASRAPTTPPGLPADDLRAAITADTIVFASPLSHFVEVQPWRS